MKKISTTALSKKLEITSQDLFSILVKEKLIYRHDEKWNLTNKGQEFGGETVESSKYGSYVVWPEDFNPLNMNSTDRIPLVNATSIGKMFDISSQRANLIFAEIGWTEKTIKGWSVTSLGRKVGGVQFEHPSGGTYVKWPESIVENKTLLRSLNQKANDSEDQKTEEETVDTALDDFRKKYPAQYRTKDGHRVRSKAEALIDNALYDYGLAHAYERKLPIEEDVLSDFYIPSKHGGKAVYIEYWGLENDPKYQERKNVKIDLYKKYELNLIELSDKHVENLDDHLPRMLLKFDIKVE
jgi:hypothetical protein